MRAGARARPFGQSLEELFCRGKLHAARQHVIEKGLCVRFKTGDVAGGIGQQDKLPDIRGIAEAIGNIAHRVGDAMRPRFAGNGDDVSLFQRLNQPRVDLCTWIALVRNIGLHSGIMFGEKVAALRDEIYECETLLPFLERVKEFREYRMAGSPIKQCGGQIVRS